VCALVELERQLGKPCREVFDFAAGTSTGAVIVAALAAGLPAARILEIYGTGAGRSSITRPPVACRCASRGAMAYRSQNLARILESELGPAAKWSLNDSPSGCC